MPIGATGDEGDSGDREKLDVGGGISGPPTCENISFHATNAGCEFWGVDLPNVWHPSTPYSLDVAANQQFAIVVANVSEEDNANVAVFSGASTSALEEAVVAPRGTYAFLLTSEQGLDPERNGAGTAFRVESDVPITAYQFQPLDNLTPSYSNDATSLLPVHVLHNDYIAVTEYGVEVNVYASGWTEESVPAGAFVTVVATENGTHVDFYPTEVLVEGAWRGVVLNRGDTFTILSDPSSAAVIDGSLSGTRVRSDRSIAAFSGNIVARVPQSTQECCVDHVEHQLLPTVAWGTRYVVAPPPDPDTVSEADPMVVRLVGAYDDTEISYPAGRPDGAPQTIDANQDLEFSTSLPVIIEGADPDKPFSVTQYLYNSGEANLEGRQGDPAMVVVPTMEQLMDRYVFLAPYGYRTSVVSIVAPTDAEVILDGQPIQPLATIGDYGGAHWGYRVAEIEPGAHSIVGDVPIGVTVFGYDDYVSYAYTGGSAVEVLHDAPPAP